MTRVIALVNQKGGVGKTTTAVNLAAYLAMAGKRVLLVDLDPQGNASAGVGVRVADGEQHIYHALFDAQLAAAAVRPTNVDGLKVLPAHADLAGANVELVGELAREYKLQQALLQLAPDFDVMLIDCPPSLGLLTVNALVAADHVLVPVQPEYYALEGLGQLVSTVELIRQHLKPALSFLGAVITMHDTRSRLGAAVIADLKANFPAKLFETVVPRNVRLAEAPSYGQPIAVYDKRSRGAEAYQELTQELLRELELVLTAEKSGAASTQSSVEAVNSSQPTKV